MLNPEQTLKFDLVRLLISAEVPTEKVQDMASPLLEWILGYSQSPPCNTDDKA